MLLSSSFSPSSLIRCASSISANMTLAPLSAKCRPIASPIPLAPPVTMAVLPEMEKDMCRPSLMILPGQCRAFRKEPESQFSRNVVRRPIDVQSLSAVHPLPIYRVKRGPCQPTSRPVTRRPLRPFAMQDLEPGIARNLLDTAELRAHRGLVGQMAIGHQP